MSLTHTHMSSNVTCYKRKLSDENKELFVKFLSQESWFDVYNVMVDDIERENI